MTASYFFSYDTTSQHCLGSCRSSAEKKMVTHWHALSVYAAVLSVADHVAARAYRASPQCYRLSPRCIDRLDRSLR